MCISSKFPSSAECVGWTPHLENHCSKSNSATLGRISAMVKVTGAPMFTIHHSLDFPYASLSACT